MDQSKKNLFRGTDPETKRKLEDLYKRREDLQAKIKALKTELNASDAITTTEFSEERSGAKQYKGIFDDVTEEAQAMIRKREIQELDLAKKKEDEAKSLRILRAQFCVAFQDAVPQFFAALQKIRPGFDVYIGNKKRFKKQDYYIETGKGYYIFTPNRETLMLLDEGGRFRVPGIFWPLYSSRLSDYARTFYYPYPESDALKLLFAGLMTSYHKDNRINYKDHEGRWVSSPIEDPNWLEMNEAIRKNDIQKAVQAFLTVSILETGKIADWRPKPMMEHDKAACRGVRVRDSGKKYTGRPEYAKYL